MDAIETVCQEFGLNYLLTADAYRELLERLRNVVLGFSGAPFSVTVLSGEAVITAADGAYLAIPPDDADAPVVVERKE